MIEEHLDSKDQQLIQLGDSPLKNRCRDHMDILPPSPEKFAIRGASDASSGQDIGSNFGSKASKVEATNENMNGLNVFDESIADSASKTKVRRPRKIKKYDKKYGEKSEKKVFLEDKSIHRDTGKVDVGIQTKTKTNKSKLLLSSEESERSSNPQRPNRYSIRSE